MSVEKPTKIYNDIYDKYPLLTKEEEIKLIILAKQGDKEAYDKLILSNLRLVSNISRKFLKTDLSHEELMQEGIMGLMKAFEKFEISFENSYATYATHWVEHYIRRTIDNHSTTIRIPVKFRKQIRLLKEKVLVNNKIDYDVLAKEMEMDTSKLKILLTYLDRPVSLDLEISEDGNRKMSDYVSYEESYESSLNHIALNQIVKNAKLSEREDLIIKEMYFEGISGTTISQKLGVHRSRVHAIKDDAIKKLKKSI